MAVHIRLARAGAKKRPFYRVVVTDHRSPRGGRFLENIGTYDPAKDPGLFVIDRARLEYWTGHGATASDTVDRLIKKDGKAAAAKAAV
jgi:small subunit ribosomal protein S16